METNDAFVYFDPKTLLVNAKKIKMEKKDNNSNSDPASLVLFIMFGSCCVMICVFAIYKRKHHSSSDIGEYALIRLN